MNDFHVSSCCTQVLDTARFDLFRMGHEGPLNTDIQDSGIVGPIVSPGNCLTIEGTMYASNFFMGRAFFRLLFQKL